MQRLQLLFIALLVGTLLYAGYRNRNLREQLDSTTRALQTVDKSNTELQECRKSLGDCKITYLRVNSEKGTLRWRNRHMGLDIKALQSKIEKLPEKDAEIQKLKAELQRVTNDEEVLRKLLEEAEKALDVLKKEKLAREKGAEAPQEKNNIAPAPPPQPQPPPQPPKQ